MFDDNEYEPVITMLRIAIKKGSYRESVFIHSIVKDAQAIRIDPSCTRVIGRTTYTFAVKLGRSKADFLDSIKADDLKEPDVRKLLEFFESL